jgi:DNA-binding Xre family transcriptional regulator
VPRFDPDKLNHALAERHLDGDQLARLTGLHRSVISRARQGKSIRLKTMAKIVGSLAAGPVDQVASELLA